MNKDNKKFIIETIFLKESLKHELSLAEFLVLVYFDNDYDSVFDVKKVAKATCLKEEEVIIAFESLLKKKLISMVSSKTESGKLIDKISLDNLYNGLKKDIEEKDTKEETIDDFLVTFQKKYGHTLSSMDYDYIKGWVEVGLSEELILGALDEAIYNGVASIRYIDKVLYAWKQKGFKTMKDVNNHLTKKDNKDEEEDKFETGVLDFNWLDDNE